MNTVTDVIYFSNLCTLQNNNFENMSYASWPAEWSNLES